MSRDTTGGGTGGVTGGGCTAEVDVDCSSGADRQLAGTSGAELGPVDIGTGTGGADGAGEVRSSRVGSVCTTASRRFAARRSSMSLGYSTV